MATTSGQPERPPSARRRGNGTPRPSPFLQAEWRDLAMLNFDIPAERLRPLVPRGTELDLWEDRALISLVGFRFLDTRVLGVPIPFHRDFVEINLRFYVRRELADEVRRGVVFMRELVPRAAITTVARAMYNEPYRTVRMRHRIERDTPARTAAYAYEWRARGAWVGLAATTSGSAAVPDPRSLHAFIAEHYWGYTRQRDGSTIEYEVTHPRWRVWTAASATLTGDVPAEYDPAFADALSAPPSSAFVADGSSVVVYRPRNLTA